VYDRIIPVTKDFTISLDGVVKDSNGNIQNTYINGDGYITVSVFTKKNKWVTFGVHRLLALTYIESLDDTSKLHVNHIDLNIKNNHISNLEWVTGKQNNIHQAVSTGNKDFPSIMVKDHNDKYSFISNLSEAAIIYNCSIKDVWSAIKNNTLLFGDSLIHFNTKSRLPPELVKSRFGLNIKPRVIKVLDIFTNEVIYFDTLNLAGKYFKTTASHIYQCITTKDLIRLFKQKYIIVDEDLEFPEITPEKFEELNRINGKEVIAYNLLNKIFYIYSSAAEFIRSSGLSKKTVTTNLRYNKIKETNNWLYIYNNGSNVEVLKGIISCPEV
jgi:hypothetical protein